MIKKPIYYKSFRSRRLNVFEEPNKPITNILNKKEHNILDIGFGTGDSSLFLRDIYPDSIIYGIEAYKTGIKNLTNKNIHLHYGDALEIIEKIESDSVNQIYMLFPDPWQKKKHRKRRLFSEYTFQIINSIIKKNGLFHFTSDNIGYALEARHIIREATNEDINFSKHRGCRPITKFEKKAILKKNFIFDLIYFKK